MEVSSGTEGERRYRSWVLDRYSLAASPRLGLAVLLSLAFLPGCGQSPVAPGSAAPMLTGYVYEVMLPGAGEPPIADVVITVTEEDGETSSARTDSVGFYSVRAATGHGGGDRVEGWLQDASITIRRDRQHRVEFQPEANGLTSAGKIAANSPG